MDVLLAEDEPCLLHEPRELLSRLCRAAYETVHEMMATAAAANGVEGFRTGMVLVAQTSGDLLNVHPHLYGLAPRGGWDRDGAWVRVPYVGPGVAERLFRAKVLAFLKAGGLLSEERERLLLSWEHATGFSIDASVKVEPEDGPGLERLARYLLRPPVSLERMRWDPESGEVAYRRKTKDGQPGAVELLEPLDFLARVIAHVHEPRLHLAHHYWRYSNLSRGRRLKARDPQLDTTPARDEPDDLTSAERRARRRAWAQLLRRVYEISPLTCPNCGAEMKIISVILDPAVVKTILDHIRKK